LSNANFKFGSSHPALPQGRGAYSRTGFDPKTISRFETGTYTPSVDVLFQLADVLGVKLKAFFADLGDEDEQRAYLFDVIHKATPNDLGKLIAAVDQALSKPNGRK
jgi:transcriptional regulator with XRE-family HTH domain